MALEQKKKPLPSWLTHPKPSPAPTIGSLPTSYPVPTLTFWPLSAGFVENHVSEVPVAVTRVKSWIGFDAVIFRAPLNEDVDGHPRAYAPPISATDRKPKDGLSAKDHINNATNQAKPPPTFLTFDPKNPVATRNSWVWAGVKHFPEDTNGWRVDDRPFLRDHNGDFPAFRRAGSGFEQFYYSTTAINMANGSAVNAGEVPYGALSNALKVRGGVRLGDFGLAIRASTGVASPFIYADAGGDDSTSVGECSEKLILNLFGGPATNEKIYHIAFPGSRRAQGWAEPELMEPTVRRMIQDLAKHDNADELVRRLAYPVHGVPHPLPESATERVALEAIMRTLIRWGLPPWGNRSTPSVPLTKLNKQIF
jgi:hypothetical protein